MSHVQPGDDCRSPVAPGARAEGPLRTEGPFRWIVALSIALLPSFVFPATVSSQTNEVDVIWELGRGGLDGIWFGRIVDCVIDDFRRLWVADGVRHRILVIDESGNLIREVGDEGSGPGEFQMIAHLRWWKGRISAFDPQLQRVVVFDSSGAHIRTQRMGTSAASNVSVLIDVGSGRKISSLTPKFVRGSPAHEPFTRVFYETEDTVQRLASIRSGGIMWYDPDARAPWGVAESGLGDGGDWGMIGDSMIVIADGYEGQVRWYELGAQARLVSVVDLGRRGMPLDAEDRSRIELGVRERYGNRIPRDAGFEGPELRSVVPRLIVDEQDQVWIQHGTEGQDQRTWTRIGQTGPVESVSLPEGLRLLTVDRGTFILTGDSDTGEPLLLAVRVDLR